MINSFDPETGKFQLENTREARNAFLRHYANANTDCLKFYSGIRCNRSILSAFQEVASVAVHMPL